MVIPYELQNKIMKISDNAYWCHKIILSCIQYQLPEDSKNSVTLKTDLLKQ